MTALTITDPFAVAHEEIAEQLEPFCDGYLDRFTDQDLLDAYDLATAWTDRLATAETAAISIAAEWRDRHGRNLPRVHSDLTPGQYADLAAQFDGMFGHLLAA